MLLLNGIGEYEMKNQIKKIGSSSLSLLSSTIIIFPFFILLNLSDGQHWITILPFVLFYVFRMTGIFFIRGIKISANSYHLLIIALFSGILGCFLGILANFLFLLYILSGAFLGISAALLPSANKSVFFYLKSKSKEITSSSIISILIFIIFLGAFSLENKIVYGFYFIFLILFLFSLYYVLNLPSYKVSSYAGKDFSIKYTIFFIVSIFLLFFIRSSRLLLSISEFHYFMLGFGILVVLIVIRLLTLNKETPLKVNFQLSLLTFCNGVIGNYLFLFASLFAGGYYGLSQVPLRVYIPYFIGIISFPIIKNKINGINIPRVSITGITIGLLIIMLTNFFSIGILIVSIFRSMLNSFLNTTYYYDAHLPDDKRLWIKQSIQNIGSIFHQIILMVIAFYISKLENISIKTFFVISKANTASNFDKQIMFTWNIMATSLVICSILFYLFISRKKHNIFSK